MRYVSLHYLFFLTPKSRSQLCKFRISAHNLRIERERYKADPLPPELRICQNCDSNSIENEYHVIMKCDKYQRERIEVFESLSKLSPPFKFMTTFNQFKFIMKYGANDTEIGSSILPIISKIMENWVLWTIAEFCVFFFCLCILVLCIFIITVYCNYLFRLLIIELVLSQMEFKNQWP